MKTKTIDCIDCGESVPYGRLSCPACGALLASVAGVIRSPLHVAVHDDPAGPVAPAVVAAVAEVEPLDEAQPEPEPHEGVESEPEPAAEPEPLAVAAAVATSPWPAASARAPEPPPWTPPADAEAIVEPRPYRVQAASTRDGVATSPAGYRPPGFALSAATAAGPAWPVGGTAFGGSARLGATERPTEQTTDETIDTDPAARYLEIGGWFVIVGAALSALGFLLPWSRVVIGAAHIGGYFDAWGLASPTHVIVLAGLLIVLGLAIVRTSVPAWLRTGVLGLASGGILIGLAWPYVVGPLGADVGVMVALFGGVALGIGGVVGSWATRHVSEDPSV